MEEIEIFHHAHVVVKKCIAYFAVFLGINLIVALLGGSFSILLSAIAAFLYIAESIIIYYIIKKVRAGQSPGKKTSYMMLTIDIIVLVAFCFIIYTAYQSIRSIGMLNYPYASFITPIVTLSFAAYSSSRIEDSLRDQLPYLGRRLGDSLRMMVIVGSLATFGVILNLLTIYWFDPGIAILIGIIGLRESLLRAIKTFKATTKEEETESTQNVLKNVCLELPSVMDVKDVWIVEFGYYCYGGCKVFLSPIIMNNEMKEIKRYIISRAIRTIPHIIAIDILLEKVEEGIIKIAVPIADSNNVTSFDETNKFTILSIKYPEADIIEQETFDIAVSDYKIIPAQKAEELALKRVEAVLSKEISNIASNELKGWFIKLYHPKSDDVRAAVKEFIYSLEK